MDHKEKALNYFSLELHCSQSVLAAFAEECGITEEQALKLGSCFGGGMRKGEVCGAVTGALMALGLLYGQKNAVLIFVMIYWAVILLQRKGISIVWTIICSQSFVRKW